MAMANILAHYDVATITALISFLVQAPAELTYTHRLTPQRHDTRHNDIQHNDTQHEQSCSESHYQQIFYVQQSNNERVGRFSFSKRLNDIIPLLSDKWLSEDEPNTKRILKAKIIETVSSKCDNFEAVNDYFLCIISYHICITKPLIVFVIIALEYEIN